jgi:hypothetical protein
VDVLQLRLRVGFVNTRPLARINTVSHPYGARLDDFSKSQETRLCDNKEYSVIYKFQLLEKKILILKQNSPGILTQW